ncbi:PucR family transcriptional regulator [Streptomyces sp. NPDC058457]|uniref:PucR family transcriptional regulator n=1 Tax=Streptomyces sp. NPDC058457 TaxID=3346507 RepID=UPI00365F7EA0
MRSLGSPRHGPEGFVNTHREALQVAGSGLPHGATPVRFADVAVVVLATRDRELAERFVDDNLGPLLAHEDADRLVLTLRHFVDSLGSPTRCGRELGIHPNTVAQRIQRAETVLGRPVDPADLSLRVALHLA